MARKENEGNNHLTGDEIQSYFDREIGQISKVVWRTMLFSMIGTGFLILAAFFLLQAAVHFISVASYGNSGATLTHASIMPFVIFGVFGYGGLAILTYVHTNRHNVHRPLILKLTGWLSLIVGTGFCIASMSLWDDILIIPLNTISSLLFAIISYLIYRWMGSPLKKIQGNRAVEHNQSNQQEKV
ncbi:hypothetical protein [Alkalicoccobacillus plakortidis]|uniref:Uncharacterized protein n=1 Tax=Alkalicoccobacillus plakortidis TaxID=444060 RepID=A0ABT0XHK0_9BACI|nr:hypothetical protein [Alkalicoccobacillus plakortidis]MCM2675190.1 hypothetical protein [Alkalicoccobacillus plakortidis]